MINKTPYLFYFIVALCALGLFSLWFFLHPNSPWHSRNHYIVAFEEIGDLQVGNAVNVNGLPNGKVEKLELRDSMVLAKVSIYSKIKIPKNSKWKIENAGLMGERVINVMLGNSKDYIADGEYAKGSFDVGGTTMLDLAMNALKEAGAIVGVIDEMADSLFSDEQIDGYKNIAKKGKNLGVNLSKIAYNAQDSILNLFDSLSVAQGKVSQIIDDIKPNLDGTVENIDLIKRDFENLAKSLEKIKSSVSDIANKIDSDKNTIGLALKEDGVLRDRLKTISDDGEKLMEKINKNGLDLNVCIFWCN